MTKSHQASVMVRGLLPLGQRKQSTWLCFLTFCSVRELLKSTYSTYGKTQQLG